MKRLKRVALTIILLIIAPMLNACIEYERDESNLLDDFLWQQIILFEKEEYVFDVNDLFKGYDINISKHKIRLSDDTIENNVIKVDKDKIIPKDNGIVKLYIELYDNNTKKSYFTYFARVVCIIESKLIEIRTIEDLKQMGKVKYGNYILKDSIDLSGINYEPIGNNPSGNEFSGMFINLEGYKISNLTITSSDNVFHGPYGGAEGGLFGKISTSFIYGIILENVNIDVSDFEGESFARAGALASGIYNSIVMNCSASGNIKAQDLAGGLFGTADNSLIYNSSFTGTVEGKNKLANNKDYIGGLIGWNGMSYVEKTSFNGVIKGDSIVGGISGYQMGRIEYLINNVFYGLHNDSKITNEVGERQEYTSLVNWNVRVIKK